MLVADMELAEAVFALEHALASLVTPGPPPSPVRRVHEGEPKKFEDAYPALVICHREAPGDMDSGSDEIFLPSSLTFNVASYFPVAELSDQDGLKLARNQTLMCFSAFYTAFTADPFLQAFGGITGIETSPIRAGASNNQGVPFFNEDEQSLFAYWWWLTLKTH